MEERTMWLSPENEKLRVKKERKKNRMTTEVKHEMKRLEWECIIDFNDDVPPSAYRYRRQGEPHIIIDHFDNNYSTHAIKTTYLRPFPEIVAAASLMISFSNDADEELEEEILTMQSTKIFQIW